MLSRGKMMKGEKGFTLIEMLVVIGIIIALAAVIIPLVLQFAGKGEEGARSAEFDSVQTGIDAMMADLFIFELKAGGSEIDPIVVNISDDDHAGMTLTTFNDAEDLFISDYLRDSHTNYCYIWDTTGRILDQSEKPLDDKDHPDAPKCP